MRKIDQNPVNPKVVAKNPSPVDAFVSNASDKVGNPPSDAIETIASTGFANDSPVKKQKWVRRRLDSIGCVVAGGTPSTSNEEYWGGAISFATPADLSHVKGTTLDMTERSITEEGLNNSAANLLPANSIVISTRAPIGYIALTTGKSVTNQGCKSVIPNADQSPLFHCYNLHRYVSEMWRYGVGTTFSEISKSDLCRIEIDYPDDIDVQRHIAEVLATCDEVIAKSERAAEKYRRIKAGLMERLLTPPKDAEIRIDP